MKKLFCGLILAMVSCVSAQAGVIAQDPLFISAQADPRVMLVASRDHQLFIKAYTDYSDLDGDGFLDTAFTPYIEYDGYFNPRKCYTYQNNRFEATSAATTETVTVSFPNGSTATKSQYVCASQWSGNLLNWASMTRADIVRKVFYGGYRSTDTESLTVLERAHLPRDVHAFAKVFDAATTANMNKFTPYNDQTSISFCNLTNDGASASKSSTNPPVMQIANGAFRLWAANEHPQCGTGSGTKPASLRETLNARVKVCDDAGGTDTISGPGPKCKTYLKTGAAKKPIGLLQQYGDADVSLSLKFGLMTGSWAHGKSGGVLRKNIGSLSNSGGKYPNNYNCATAGEGFVSGSTDEVDFCTGLFVNNQGLPRSASSTDDLPTTGGVIGTLNRLRIAGWDGSKYDGVCNNPGVTSFANGNCVDWGNPISEMYLESLRYLQAGNATTKLASDTSAASPTANFNGSDASYIAGLPQLTWKDPIPAAEWCAKSNIVMISTGLNSFDFDETAHDLGWGKSTATLTNEVADASHEKLTGNFMIGSVTGASNYESVCSSKALGDLSQASGICPEVPSVEGSYHVAGLALGTSLFDLRSGYASKRNSLWSKSKPEYALRQPLTTFAVALAENLPDFSIPVGVSGKEITFIPFCQANSNGSAALGDTGWRACSMVDLEVEQGTNQTAGSFKIMWEDSTWGNDYDMDGVAHIRYCVGAACNAYAGQNGMPAIPDADKLYLKVASMTAAAGHALKYGYTISGSTADGTVMDVLRPGNANYSTYAANSEFTKPVTSWSTPAWVGYSISASTTANLMQNPLYYTAKYAAWPNWDKKNNATRATLVNGDGQADNFFRVRNPAGLEQAIGSALKESLADPSSSSSIATNSTRLDTDTFVYQARFKATDWSGQVLAYPVVTVTNTTTNTTSAALGTLAWDAGVLAKYPAESLRRIYTYNRSATLKGIDFKWGSLSAKQKAGLDDANVVNTSSSVISYLRGDQSQELKDTSVPSDGVFDVGIYRPRTSLMGDIINSDPVFIGGQNFSYGNISSITGYDSYAAQVDKKFSTTGSAKNPLIVVNSNDGMMHVIDAKNGNEIFTYLPSWLICPDETAASGCNSGANSSPLRNLLNANMNHQYLLDGNLVVGDAYVDTGAGVAWKTLLVGAAAAGGKGVFAVDLTKSYDGTSETLSTSDVATTQSTYAALTATDTVLWEFTDKFGDADLGYTYGQPVIARMANDQWAAVFGNGYSSANGKAVLYIVNLADGSLIKKIEVGDGSTAASPNGLSAPAAIFDSGTGALSAIFAGDLKGNLWKFDVTGSNTNNWKVDNGAGTPLFTAFDDAGNRQPITAGLDIGTHPNGGYMVYFGTGKYFEKGDNTSTAQQTIYGIWDKTASNDEIAASTVDTVSEKDVVLQKHSILIEMPNPLAGGGDIRVTDDTGSINWANKRGWYLNMGVTSRERVVTPPILRNKRVIVTSMIPSASPCDFGGTSWIMEFDPETGNRPSFSVFDLNNNGTFTSSDYVSVTIGGVAVNVPANGVKSTEGIIKSPAIISAGSKDFKISSGTTGNVLVVAEQGSTTRPRPAWRQIQ
ncbi:pilus assembly protein [Ferribacterium limneticum]|uniref:pilus assembly protein n=1 Tax=Ferribacterium limneticum TaxID=76259 RepID=UPI001CF9F4CC|nr:PilC/PilY family type IV pilus protein [Ferribacterium limneticum]UCV29630.1 pilus assembly protein PilC [Ferribacterium limneticum]UCV33549.1 pilus assembly protein PilC [Ferribacterium limneticum]